jgi:hypothetical protein
MLESNDSIDLVLNQLNEVADLPIRDLSQTTQRFDDRLHLQINVSANNGPEKGESCLSLALPSNPIFVYLRLFKYPLSLRRF